MHYLNYFITAILNSVMQQYVRVTFGNLQLARIAKQLQISNIAIISIKNFAHIFLLIFFKYSEINVLILIIFMKNSFYYETSQSGRE